MIPAAPGPTTDLPTDDLLRQIDDIKGVGEISLWPLAPGWWVLVGLTAIAVVFACVVVADCVGWDEGRRGAASSGAAE